MTDERWNPWKLTTIGLGLVIATALITGLVVASWNNNNASAPATSASAPRTTPAPAAPSRPPAVATAPAPAPPRHVATPAPSPADVEACNTQANSQAGDKTLNVVKDA